MLLIVGLCCACSTTLHASVQDSKELQIRAAYLLNFMKFTTWPDEAFTSADSTLVFLLIGDDPYGRVLEQTFSREQVRGREVVVQRSPVPRRRDYRDEATYKEALSRIHREIQSAHIVHLTSCDSGELDSLLDGVDRPYVLTVGDQRECAEGHTALALARDGDRVIFYANVRQIESLDLQVSSRLLSLARIIDKK